MWWYGGISRDKNVFKCETWKVKEYEIISKFAKSVCIRQMIFASIVDSIII